MTTDLKHEPQQPSDQTLGQNYNFTVEQPLPNKQYWANTFPLTHLCPPLRSTFAVRETASLGIKGGTAAPLKPLRDDSDLRALSSLRGLRGAPEGPPLCRETSVSRTANVGTVGKNGLKSGGCLIKCTTQRTFFFLQKNENNVSTRRRKTCKNVGRYTHTRENCFHF